MLLRHQLIVLHRKHRGRVSLRNFDRLLLVWLYRLLPALLDSILIVQPETVIRWHRRGLRGYWCWRSRNPGRRQKVNLENPHTDVESPVGTDTKPGQFSPLALVLSAWTYSDNSSTVTCSQRIEVCSDLDSAPTTHGGLV